MRKTIGLTAVGLALSLYTFSWAASQPRTIGDVKAFKTVFAPVSQITVSTTTSITPTATYMVVESTGGNVIFTITSNIPAISTATAINGQYLVLYSTTTAANLFISTGTATGIIGDDSMIVISSTKSAVAFIYNSTLLQWVEIGKQ